MIARFIVVFLLAMTSTVVWGGDRPSGTLFQDCPQCPELVVVPAGTFVMGAGGRYEQEQPAHPVTIAQPFAIGRHEVTFDEWDACVAAGGCDHTPDDHAWGRGRQPVINVTFAQVETYLAWLSETTGHTYRLPSEAEWEYTARAGTTSEFWWGDDVGTNRANCRDCGSKWSGKQSAPVASFAANPFGLFDTAGNVWEWAADCWVATHDGAPGDGTTRTDGDCRWRVIRGGSWYYFKKNARGAWRFRNDARVNSYGIGFRVLRELR